MSPNHVVGREALPTRPAGPRRWATAVRAALRTFRTELGKGQAGSEGLLNPRQRADHELLDSLGVAVYVTDPAGRITYFNEAAAELWGCRPMLGDARFCGSWRLFWPNGSPMRHDECPMAVAVREQRAVHGGEAVAERPDGTRVPFAAYPTPLRDSAGHIVGALNVLVDISGRKATEAALADSEARLRAVFDTTPECIKVVASDGTLLRMNPAGLGMIEADGAGEVEGRSVFTLIAPEDLAVWQANHARVCAGEAMSWEFAVVGLRGGRRRMETHAAPLPLPGRVVAQLAITRDVTARHEAEQRQSMLAGEVDHRAKNVLAVALSVIRMTRAEDPRRFAEAVEGRIAALAHAHTLLADQHWVGAELRWVAETELAPYLAARCADSSGPPVVLAPGAVQPVAMVLHELATNAAKFGALSHAGGRLELSWTVPPDGTLRLVWDESGGPPVTTTGPPGFGSKLIEATVCSQLGGTVVQDWRPQGLRCEIVIASQWLRLDGGARSADPTPSGRMPTRAEMRDSDGGLNGPHVLLVEDEPVVALEFEMTLRRLGYQVVGPAATLGEALRLIETEERIDAAVLDINLAGSPSYPAAERLSERGVPVIFATGYGELAYEWRDGGRARVLRKPLGPGDLEAALRQLIGHDPARQPAPQDLGGRPLATPENGAGSPAVPAAAGQ
ncbi:MAG: PAS domain S-box protein [Alphaproteobacteria bacterium]|nr:PAS domain S-box protein [Alphaproteobacteria bacterium]